ncbi:MAG: nucleotidyltransferase domain-containing protein [Bacteroidetes bacterium]|nr:MAG: nucleotidyltransferase domain-containing protein [Bacteroidota bacterium]
MKFINRIKEVSDVIVSKFNPDKIILFGSYAIGNSDSNSDLDLLIVMDTEKPVHLRNVDIHKSFLGTKTPMDILVYTNDEFEVGQKDKFSFIYQAMLHAKVLYERKK